MEFEASLVELHRIMRALTQENEALRELVRDAQPLMEKHYSAINSAYGLLHAVREPDQAKIEAWQDRAQALLREETTT